jgi:hypothetical protein
MTPHHGQILLATDGQGVLVLPTRQSAQTRPSAASHHSSAVSPTSHVNLVGPLPPLREHTYLFTVIDRTSWWPEAFPLSSITTAVCARTVFNGCIPRFGVPANITSDKGASSRPPYGRPYASYPTSATLLLQPTTHNQMARGEVPKAAEGRLEGQGRYRLLARPSPVGDVGCPRHLPQEQPFLHRRVVATVILEVLQTAMASCSQVS